MNPSFSDGHTTPPVTPESGTPSPRPHPSTSSLPFHPNWQPRFRPLQAGAVAARGEAAHDLARRLLARDDEYLAKLSGVAGAQLLILLGESEALPWADGAIYLGHEPSTAALWMPTTLAPDVPLPLFERALRVRFSQLALPLAVLPQWNLVLPLGAAHTIARGQLESFVKEFAIGVPVENVATGDVSESGFSV